MPHRRFDWHEHIKDIEGEYLVARIAFDQLNTAAAANPDVLETNHSYHRNADNNLEGTYLVRIFAAFEAALRSYFRARHHDPDRDEVAAVLIDTIGGRRGQGISAAVRRGAHEVREVRNYWAHENEGTPPEMTMAQARARLQTFLSWLPEQWA